MFFGFSVLEKRAKDRGKESGWESCVVDRIGVLSPGAGREER